MMFVWKQTWVRPPKMLLKAYRPAIKQALRDTVRYWWEKRLPWHFEAFAKSKYKYKRRSKKTDAIKVRDHGHRTPLVRTGDLENTLSRRIAITGTSKSVRGRMAAPWYTKYRGETGRQPDKEAEITAVAQGDATFLANYLRERVTERLAQAGGTTYVR